MNSNEIYRQQIKMNISIYMYIIFYIGSFIQLRQENLMKSSLDKNET